MSIDLLSKINYIYNTHTFIYSGETITSTENNPIKISALIDGYTNIFNEGMNDKTELLESLSDILDIDSLTIEQINNNDFYSRAKTISGKTIDSNCLEGYRAYSFYLEKIILLLNKLDDAINQGQAAIEEIENLVTKEGLENVPANQTVEGHVNNKVCELLAELYLADQAIADVKAEFESCLKYNGDTKSWDKSSYEVSDSRLTTKPESLGDLRDLSMKITDTGKASPVHKIACFSELNLLDRLRYIRYYYELILNGQDSDYQVFPDDSEKGYPCVPDKESTTDTKATESMGGFELFYVGYLVDRDGSIDAYSSCLEAKSKAITDNISLQSEHIEAYNQYLTFINRATQLLNESQRDRAAAIAHGAHLGLTYFCGGTMRDLLEVDGVNYIVLSYTTSEGSRDNDDNPGKFNYGYNDRYLLVRADEKGLEALYNTEPKNDPSKPSNSDEAKSWYDTGKKLEVITANDLSGVFTKDGNLTWDCEYTPTSGFKGTNFYRRVRTKSNGDYPLIVSSSEANREILVWDCPREKAQEYLPKQLIIQEIEPDSVAAYNRYDKYCKESEGGWGYNGDNPSAEEANRVINSWTSAFSNKSDYINTAIETINTDITALRTKMDTIDSLCSTLRNRSFETKKTLISNLRS